MEQRQKRERGRRTAAVGRSARVRERGSPGCPYMGEAGAGGGIRGGERRRKRARGAGQATSREGVRKRREKVKGRRKMGRAGPNREGEGGEEERGRLGFGPALVFPSFCYFPFFPEFRRGEEKIKPK